MKADLAKREPEMLAAWERDDVYGKIRKVAMREESIDELGLQQVAANRNS